MPHRIPSVDPPVPVADWATLLTTEYEGPVQLQDTGLVVDRELGAHGAPWVPVRLLDGPWELLTAIHADTFVPASPPSGWAWVGGSVTVSGGLIRVTAPPPLYCILAYTLSEVGDGDEVVIVARMVGVSVTSGSASNNASVWWVDGRATVLGYVYWLIRRGVVDKSYYAGTSATALHAPITDLSVVVLNWCPYRTGDGDISGCQIIDQPRRLVEAAMPSNYLANIGAQTPTIRWYANATAGGTGNTEIGIEYALVYRRAA